MGGILLYLLAGAVMLYGHLVSREASQLERIIRAYYDSSAQAIAIINSEGEIVLWSQGAERLLGWSSREAIGQDIVMLVPMNMLARHSKKFDSRMKKIEQEGVDETAQTLVVRCEAMTKGLGKVALRITIRFFEVDGEPHMNVTLDQDDAVEFLTAPPLPE